MLKISYQTKYDQFTQDLVFAMLAIQLSDYESTKQYEIINESLAVYKEFTLDFFAQNYPEFDLDKIKKLEHNQLTNSQNEDNLDSLKTKLDSCHQAFLAELSKSWEN